MDYLNNSGRGKGKAIADVDQREFVKGIWGTELPGELGLKKKLVIFPVNTVFVSSAYRFLLVL